MTDDLIDYRAYDLQARYDHFNRLCFDGKLPRVPLRFARLKGALGICACKTASLPSRAKLPRSLRTIGARVLPETISITLDNTMKWPEEKFDAILIHEMIHAWFYFANDARENHGMRFIAKLRECERIVGFKIPVTEKLSDPVYADLPLKRMIVMVWTRKRKPDEKLFAALNVTSFGNMRSTLPEDWDRYCDVGDTLEVYDITSKLWTELAMRVPVQRPKGLRGHRGKGALAFYYYRYPEHAADLQAHGKHLMTLTRA